MRIYLLVFLILLAKEDLAAPQARLDCTPFLANLGALASICADVPESTACVCLPAPAPAPAPAPVSNVVVEIAIPQTTQRPRTQTQVFFDQIYRYIDGLGFAPLSNLVKSQVGIVQWILTDVLGITFGGQIFSARMYRHKF